MTQNRETNINKHEIIFKVCLCSTAPKVKSNKEDLQKVELILCNLQQCIKILNYYQIVYLTNNVWDETFNDYRMGKITIFMYFYHITRITLYISHIMRIFIQIHNSENMFVENCVIIKKCYIFYKYDAENLVFHVGFGLKIYSTFLEQKLE